MNSELRFYFPFGRLSVKNKQEADQQSAGADGGDKGSTNWSKGLLPFDGSCQCSKGSDLTLEFDDGSTLKTHVALLKMASSILESMLECPGHESLHLEKTTKDVWLVILNQLHPKSPVVIIELDIVDTEFLEDVGMQAKKYELQLVFEQMDSFFCILMLDVDPYALRGRYERADCSKEEIAGIPLRLELPKSSERIIKLADQVVSNRALCLKGHRNYGEHGAQYSSQYGYHSNVNYNRSGMHSSQATNASSECAAAKAFLAALPHSASDSCVRDFSQQMIQRFFSI